MSYTPTNWQTGDVITAEKLNNMEAGIGDLDTDKIDKPSNPASGAFLVWNGSTWAAQTLATWQGGSY